MPLRATCISGDIQSFQLTGDQWAELKASYRSKNLRMPCCQAPAIPKTSPRGLHFFSHACRGECTSAPESEDHLWCKELVASAAIAAGWAVTTECHGQSPRGEDWIADVFCEKGRAKVALEIQMSHQTAEVLHQRHERYQASGVRAAWFYAAQQLKMLPRPSNALPAFALSAFSRGQLPTIPQFNVTLPEFVTGLLFRRLQWTISEINKPILIEVLDDICWACEQPVTHPFGHIEGMQIGEVPGDEWHPRAFTASFMSRALENLHKVVANGELRGAGINTIALPGELKGKQENWPYCGLCPHCGAAQNNHFVGEKVRRTLYWIASDRRAIRLVSIDRLSPDKGRWVFIPDDSG